MQRDNARGLLTRPFKAATGFGRKTEAIDAPTRRQRRGRGRSLAFLASLAVVVGVLGAAAIPASAAFTFQNDEQGANDQPNQKDLTRHGVDATGLPTSIDVTWNWDDIGLSGANTGDACSLFDTDLDAKVNFAVCVTIEGDPAVQASVSPRLYTCGDDKVDRCTQPVTQIPSFSTTCTVSQTATDPFGPLAPNGPGDAFPLDTTANCHIIMSDVGGTSAKLINTCSYPSEEPNSDPSDCVLIIRDGFLVIDKVASPDDSSALFDFTLDSGSTPVFTAHGSETSNVIAVRTDITHSLAEAAPTGWQLDSASCAKGNGTTGTKSGNTISGIDVDSDETVTCTFNNSLTTGTLLVKKHVNNDNGGTLDASAFNLHVKQSGSDVAGSPASGSETGTSYTLVAGAYNVSEDSPPSGYAKTGISGACAANGNVTVVAGQTKTCTITNDDIAPKLHLRKEVTNDNGGQADPTDWTLSADGTGPNDLSGQTPVDSGATLQSDTWTLSESGGPSGYSASDWDCSGGIQGTGADKDKITLDIGEEATCTITNDDIAPKLHLRKEVTNDNGGQADPTDWTLSADGTGPNDLSGQTPVDSGATLQSDTWTLSESGGPSGYSASDWDCSGGIQGTGADKDKITLDIGEEATCTITNDDIAPKLHLRKEVTNDNGGQADPTDWTLSADGTGPNDLSGQTPVDSGATLQSDTWTLSESGGPSGYSASDWDCSGGIQGTGADKDKITLDIGEEATCTITNDDIAPKLHLRKEVTNDNGGQADPTDWTLSADGTGPNDLSGQTPVDSGATLQSDTWTLSESGGPSGYSASDWDCSGGIQGTGADKDKITLDIGEEATCTITNDDIAPKLHLRKEVTNDNGGQADPTDWTLSADGTGPNDLSGQTPVDSGATLQSDTWTLSESGGPSGYSASDWDCSGGIQGTGADKDKITLDIGEEATCTITNDDIAPKLHLRKLVDNGNGGTAAVTDWTLHADGAGGNDLSGQTPVDSDSTLKADTFTLSESGGPAGYSASDWDCSGGTQGTGADKDKITLTIDEEATCTITNTRDTGKLELKKDLEPDSDPGRFNLVIKHGTTTIDSEPNAGDGGSTGENSLDTGTYRVLETPGTSPATSLADYQKSIECKGDDGTGATVAQTSTDSGGPLNVNVTKNADIVCTITNVRETGTIEVKKNLEPDSDPGRFNLVIKHGTTTVDSEPNAGDGGSTGENKVNTGTYKVSETAGTSPATSLADYQKSIECKADDGTGQEVASAGPDSAGPLSVAVAYGDDIVCTITNVRETGTIEVKKNLEPDSDPGRFNLVIKHGTTTVDSEPNAGDGGSTGENKVNTGTYKVSETAGTSPATSLADYQKSIECKADDGTGQEVASAGPDSAGPLSVAVAYGDDIVCTITNVRETGTIEVKKNLEPDSDPGRFNLVIKHGTTTVDSEPNAGDGGSTGENKVNTGTYKVSETAGTSPATSLADYQKSIECKADDGTGQEVASAGPDSAGPLSVAVAYGDDIVCTITNVRETGTIEVIKKLEPTTDSGRFNLQVDGVTHKTDAGDGGTTGPVTVNTGAGHSVGETAGTNTWLSHYRSSIACTRNGQSARSGTGTTLGGIAVNKDDVVVCTITNVRKPLVNPFTPGYWKNHEAKTTSLLPIDLGGYTVDTFAKATAVFNNMNCGSSKPNDAIGCLAGHLLAAKLNTKNLSDPCIHPVIVKADAFLKGQTVTYAGITATGVDYTGPAATYTLTDDQRSLAIAIKNALDKYNNGGGCT